MTGSHRWGQMNIGVTLRTLELSTFERHQLWKYLLEVGTGMAGANCC